MSALAPAHPSAKSSALRITTAYFEPSLARTLSYAEQLVKDIPADRFAHMPLPNMNHPAFCIGHLSLYPNRLFNMVGRPDLVVEKPKYPELFQAGVACVEQDGRYPAKEEITAYYFERYKAIARLLPEIGDDMLARPNPVEGRMRELFPTIGAAMCFLLNNHQMMHLGQVSAWRRAIGLGSAM